MRGEGGARDLAIASGIVIALSRFAPDGFVWPIAVVLFAGVVLGSLQVIAEADPAGRIAGVPIESLLLPGGAALAALGALRLVPIGVALAPAMVLSGGLVGLAVVTELRLARASGPPSSTDRTAIRAQVLIVGFLGFVGVAALVPGGLPLPGVPGVTEPGGPSGSGALQVVVHALANGFIALLLGYRTAALRGSNLRDVSWFAVTAAAVILIATIALRSIEIPRFLGPALLMLVFFLWDAIHSGGTVRRRDPRRAWEMGLLAVLAILVIGWSISARGS